MCHGNTPCSSDAVKCTPICEKEEEAALQTANSQTLAIESQCCG
jgi:hypothetical protein